MSEENDRRIKDLQRVARIANEKEDYDLMIVQGLELLAKYIRLTRLELKEVWL